jgi:hypothetical protein
MEVSGQVHDPLGNIQMETEILEDNEEMVEPDLGAGTD